MLPSSPIVRDCARFRPTQPEARLRSRAVFVPPLPRAQARIRSRAESCSTASSDGRQIPSLPDISLGVPCTRHSADSRTQRQDCQRRPSDISPLIECHRSAGSQQLRPFSPKARDRHRWPSPAQLVPSLLRRIGTGATLPSAMRTSSITPSRKATQSGDAHFGDRLRIAGSDFPRMMKISRKSPRQANGLNQLIGRQLHLFVAGVKVDVRHAALAPHRNKNQFCFVSQQRRQRVGGRRCVDDVAAERSSILIRDSAGPARSALPAAEIRALRFRVLRSSV